MGAQHFRSMPAGAPESTFKAAPEPPRSGLLRILMKKHECGDRKQSNQRSYFHFFSGPLFF
jgi:hypothetical protein